jgi:hypothetical protein
LNQAQIQKQEWLPYVNSYVRSPFALKPLCFEEDRLMKKFQDETKRERERKSMCQPLHPSAVPAPDTFD